MFANLFDWCYFLPSSQIDGGLLSDAVIVNVSLIKPFVSYPVLQHSTPIVSVWPSFRQKSALQRGPQPGEVHAALYMLRPAKQSIYSTYSNIQDP